MENKLLVGGSAIAVVVLVLASLSPVVGYNSVETSAKDSPLFNVRTNRAINKESKALTSDYIGKGDILPFPNRNKKIAQLQQVIDKISKMNNENFNRMTYLLKNRIAHLNEEFKYTADEIISTLFLMRDNPELLCFLIYFVWGLILVIGFILSTLFTDCYTWGYSCYTDDCR